LFCRNQVAIERENNNITINNVEEAFFIIYDLF